MIGRRFHRDDGLQPTRYKCTVRFPWSCLVGPELDFVLMVLIERQLSGPKNACVPGLRTKKDRDRTGDPAGLSSAAVEADVPEG